MAGERDWADTGFGSNHIEMMLLVIMVCCVTVTRFMSAASRWPIFCRLRVLQ
jgi:hypothetical protein